MSLQSFSLCLLQKTRYETNTMIEDPKKRINRVVERRLPPDEASVGPD